MKSVAVRFFALIVIFSIIFLPANNIDRSVLASAPLADPAGEPEGVGVVQEEKGASGAAIYMIRLADAPLVSYRGNLPGLQATSPEATRARLNLQSRANQAYLNFLKGKRGEFKSRAQRALARSLDVVYEYSLGNHGLAVRMTPEEAAQIAQLPGVIFVQRDFERELQTDNGPGWIGASGLWDGTQAPQNIGSYGEGVVVGVIDTGINYSNPSFAAVDPVNAYAHVNPLGSGVFLGNCAAGASPAYAYCNNKLIGVHGYPSANSGDPVDTDGHGSHTASTAAGNFVNITLTPPTGPSYPRTISGVAPRANIIAYAACCNSSDLTAAIEDAIADYALLNAGPQIVPMALNYSIGSTSPTANLWNDFDATGFLNARIAGIFVANSAGNAGPGKATVGSPSDAPWLTSVAASTHDRMFKNGLINLGGVANPPANITGKSITGGVGPAAIVYAGNYGAGSNLCPPFPAGTFSGQIVVCDRGVYGRVTKGQNVLAAGAGGMILAENSPTGSVYSVTADAHVLPAAHIGYADGVALKAWLATGTPGTHTGTIAGTTVNEDAANGDVMALFSSRGPNRAIADIITPSIAAPGLDILAAYGTHNETAYDVISGTSMASPHVAGAGALVMALHPDWSPAEVQSALMMTAAETTRKEDGVTAADPFDVGAGRVDLTRAALAGLVMDETGANYLAANPALPTPGDVKTLNTPSMGNSQCVGACSWTRSVRSTLSTSANWTITTAAAPGLTISVSPTSLTLAPGATAQITVTANVGTLPVGAWVFGKVILTENSARAPQAHLPVGVAPEASILPALVTISTHRHSGSQAAPGFKAGEITDLNVNVFGLAPLAPENFLLSADPTYDDPFDDLSQVHVKILDVPAGTKRLVAEILSTTALDVDLILGTGETPSLATQTVAAATSNWDEQISVMDPAPGKYWMLVQNWDGAANDSIDLGTLVLTTDSGNMQVSGPSSLAAGTPFEVSVAWDIPAMLDGDRYYGAFTLGPDAGHPGQIGSVPVDFEAHFYSTFLPLIVR